MPEKFGGEQFLSEKYPDLPKSPEVESAAKRKELRTGKKVRNKHEKVEAHLERLEEIFTHDDPKKFSLRVKFLKDQLHNELVITEKDIPENYWDNQKRIAREQGHGDIEITDELRRQGAKTIIKDQEQSLDAWIDYLGSYDATYPTWLKYWTFRSITKLSQYDKEAHEFKKRSKSTTAPFPDINREALAYVLDAVEKKRKGETQEITDENWEKLLKNENFGKLYAYAIEQITPASEEEKENIRGEWVKYDGLKEGEDLAEFESRVRKLYESLQGHGTGWCTAGESTAKAQLELGDFYVFYTKDKNGGYKVPRVAIRMQQGEIAEVRGINADQNLEPIMLDIAKEKTQTLPGGEKYEKKVSDMKKLTEIEKKLPDTSNVFRGNTEDSMEDASQRDEDLDYIRSTSEEVELTKEELRFLYEIDNKIEGFGYQEDPRIEELKNKRDLKTDYVKIFDCKSEQIALYEYEVDDKTIALLAHFDGEIFELMPKNLKYIMKGAWFKNSKIRKLVNLEYISGYVNFSYSKIKDLGMLKKIGGNVNFNNSEIENLGQLKSIGGDVIISKDSKLDFSNVKIGGQIIKE